MNDYKHLLFAVNSIIKLIKYKANIRAKKDVVQLFLMSEYIQNLNEQQKKAVSYSGGPVRVIAGAGTGKTRVLTHRIAYLIAEVDVQPEQILALTFTNKAAEEMQGRVADMTNEDVLPTTSTFHAFGARLLRAHAGQLPVSKSFTIRDGQQSRKIIKQATKANNYHPQEYKSKQIAGFINRCRSQGQTMEAFLDSRRDDTGLAPVVADVWPTYRARLRDQDSVDFADLLMLTRKLLREVDSLRARYQSRWQHILVDEYQDTNITQSDIIQLLAGDKKPQNVFVVGDGDQTIYTWRGATTENILSFEQQFRNAETIVLSQNYRSTDNILTAANDVIAVNDNRHDKTLEAVSEAGDKLSLYEAADEKTETRHMVDTFRKHKNNGSLGEWAVLYRTNAQSRVIEEALMQANIPYEIAGTSFFDRKEVRDLLAYVRLSLNRDADADRRRIYNRPRRGIGEKTLERMLAGNMDKISNKRTQKVNNFRSLLDTIEEIITTQPPSDAILAIIEKSGLQNHYEDEPERIENMQEVATMAAQFNEAFDEDTTAMQTFLQEIALTGDQDTLGNEAGVQLMTVHAAKGLEFPRVWICGLEDELFPQKRDDKAGIDEEERRLFYVALTRAQKKVVLSYAQSRQLYGSREWKQPSPFLDHISDDLLVNETEPGQGSESGADEVIFFD
jgi:DNA helicase-2/ATP-dependent DNA helicase PcrA